MDFKLNKPVRVTKNGRHQGYIDLHRSWFGRLWYQIKAICKFIAKWTIIICTIGLFFYGYYLSHPKTIYTNAEIIKEVESLAPVLKRIAQAESHNSHFCTEALIKSKMCADGELGQVLVRSNTNNTIDVGRYQINVYYWGKQATAQGLNIFDEQDNEKMAIWIYKNYGTEPWYSSGKNW